MDVEEFREFGKASVDYLADYFETIRERQVHSDVEPGYLTNFLPDKAPKEGQAWTRVLKDVDDIIVPGLSHWHSPHFHAYYPTANSFPGIVGELILSGLGPLSKDWLSSPACMELEVRMMDWLAKLLGLPEHFLNSSPGPGGGVIQNAASESTLVALLCGTAKAVGLQVKLNPQVNEVDIKSRLVAYTSEQSNSSVEKAGLLASVSMQLLPTDKNGSLRGATLREAISRDKSQGRIPCCVIATLGTTGTCAFDNLSELVLVCQEEQIWLHVDAAYAGSAFACPEYRHLMAGVEDVDSFNFNPHKWLLINSDCSAMWFKDARYFPQAYQPSKTKSVFQPEIQHWQIPSSRRFRALKIWFVLRIYGVSGIQQHIRHQISLAEYFAKLVQEDDRFQMVTSSMGLVCFRVAGEDCLTQKLLDGIASRKKLFLMAYYFQAKLVVRFVICSRFTDFEDVDFAWREIVGRMDEEVTVLHSEDEKKFAELSQTSDEDDCGNIP